MLTTNSTFAKFYEDNYLGKLCLSERKMTLQHAENWCSDIGAEIFVMKTEEIYDFDVLQPEGMFFVKVEHFPFALVYNTKIKSFMLDDETEYAVLCYWMYNLNGLKEHCDEANRQTEVIEVTTVTEPSQSNQTDEELPGNVSGGWTTNSSQDEGTNLTTVTEPSQSNQTDEELPDY